MVGCKHKDSYSYIAVTTIMAVVGRIPEHIKVDPCAPCSVALSGIFYRVVEYSISRAQQ